MKIDELEKYLKNIKFDNYYVEATLQFNLLLKLASNYKKNIIFPERSIKHYNLTNSTNLTKKEIDIVLEHDNNIAIELKMPMNGQVPEQMFKFIEDIKFLEELKSSGKFSTCYLITVTNDNNFWGGKKQNGIYSFFRNCKKITGKIYKPTGENKNIKYHKIDGEYKIEWKIISDDYKYFIIQI